MPTAVFWLQGEHPRWLHPLPHRPDALPLVNAISDLRFSAISGLSSCGQSASGRLFKIKVGRVWRVTDVTEVDTIRNYKNEHRQAGAKLNNGPMTLPGAM